MSPDGLAGLSLESSLRDLQATSWTQRGQSVECCCRLHLGGTEEPRVAAENAEAPGLIKVVINVQTLSSSKALLPLASYSSYHPHG